VVQAPEAQGRRIWNLPIETQHVAFGKRLARTEMQHENLHQQAFGFLFVELGLLATVSPQLSG
jgi:hypothetical protein